MDGTTTQVCFRVLTLWIRRADAIASKISERDGMPSSRNDVFRAAILRGLRSLEAEHQIATSESHAKARRRRRS